jgi:hypothetical protein
MGVRHAPGALSADRRELESWFRTQGLAAWWWTNRPGDTYGWHDHPYHKVLACQRLDIEPGTEHAATVGSDGVTCVEAPTPA